ncbi:MAG: hypothetical protein HY007_03525 [Candidatus Sungbacteria bacterium]|nr:hypothetical protein [Candidatus Sungbacteria bacterium]
MEQKKLLAFFVALLIGFGGGFWIGKYITSAEIQKLHSQIEQAQRMYPMLAVPSQIRALSGRVAAIQGSTLTVEVSSANPFDDLPKIRAIAIGRDTKIIKSVPKDPKVLKQEFAAYQKFLVKTKAVASAPRPGTGPAPGFLPAPPLPFQDQTILPQDLHVGDGINVTAAENIKTTLKFSAQEIRITNAVSSQRPRIGAVPAPILIPAPLASPPR